MEKGEANGRKATAYAALALAFASFGDAFLYPYLPLNSNVVGVPVVWVGVLLSVNRFVRIFSNGVMVNLIDRYGLRIVMIAAVILAIVSTAGYGIASGVVAWILFRILWGLSFSAMRIATVGYALQQSNTGFALGVSKGLQEAGPTLALFLAPFLLATLNADIIFLVLALMSLPALVFAVKLPKVSHKTAIIKSRKFLNLPSLINAITLFSAILIDGIIVVALGILFIAYRENITEITAVALAAFYLGYRRICLIVFSPVGGWIAHRVGLNRVFILTTGFIIAGFFILVMGWVAVGSVIIFTFYSVNAAITPGIVSKNSHHSLSAVAENATWRDIGAAFGTLAGGFLMTSPHLVTTIIIGIFVLLILLMLHTGTAQKTFKLFYSWK